MRPNALSGEGKGEQKQSIYAQRKAAKEKRDIAKLYKRTGIDEPFDMPATLDKAIAHVNTVFAWEASCRAAKANAGVDISDGENSHIVETEFFETSDEDFAETYVISDMHLRWGIKQATDERVKPALLGEEGLRSARTILARLMQEMGAKDAVESLLGYLCRRIGLNKEARLNGWNLVAQRFAAELYDDGIDNILAERIWWRLQEARQERAA